MGKRRLGNVEHDWIIRHGARCAHELINHLRWIAQVAMDFQ